MDYVIKSHAWESLNIKDNDGNNALHVAAKCARPEVMWEFRHVPFKVRGYVVVFSFTCVTLVCALNVCACVSAWNGVGGGRNSCSLSPVLSYNMKLSISGIKNDLT